MKLRKQARGTIGKGQFDLCVIGGGATGAGCALDAQLRGLRTVVVDAGDFASGASSASTKLVHGGVRYLEQAVKHANLEEYRMVKHALEERVYMLANAPHLARASEFLVPVYSRGQAAYYRVGMKIYDWLSGSHGLFPSRYLTRSETLRRMPGLRADGLRGAISYADGQFDDARYGLALVKTFTEAGGEALNYARVTSFLSDEAGKLAAANLRDELTNEVVSIKARVFVNATGSGSDAVRRMASPKVHERMRPSKGVHILFLHNLFPSEKALLVPKTEDGRLIFAVPWQGRLLVGTTDDEASAENTMVVLRKEAEYLLRQLNPYLSSPLQREQIVSGFAGLRPLVAAGDGRNTKELVRDHEVEVDADSGLISILGGKWTTYRLMAEDTINSAEKLLRNPETQCKTKHYKLNGAEEFSKESRKDIARRFEIEDTTALHLAEKFGTEADRVLKLCEENSDWKRPLIPEFPAILAEAVYCVREEMAVTIEDVLARRVGIQLLDWRKALQAAPVVAEILAAELGWTNDEKHAALDAYKEKIQGFLLELGLTEAN